MTINLMYVFFSLSNCMVLVFNSIFKYSTPIEFEYIYLKRTSIQPNIIKLIDIICVKSDTNTFLSLTNN